MEMLQHEDLKTALECRTFYFSHLICVCWSLGSGHWNSSLVLDLTRIPSSSSSPSTGLQWFACLVCFVCSETEATAVLKACCLLSSWAGCQWVYCPELNGITWWGPSALFVGHFFIQKHALRHDDTSALSHIFLLYSNQSGVVKLCKGCLSVRVGLNWFSPGLCPHTILVSCSEKTRAPSDAKCFYNLLLIKSNFHLLFVCNIQSKRKFFVEKRKWIMSTYSSLCY